MAAEHLVVLAQLVLPVLEQLVKEMQAVNPLAVVVALVVLVAVLLEVGDQFLLLVVAQTIYQ